MSNVIVSIDCFYKQFPQFFVEEYENICPGCLKRAVKYVSLMNEGILYGCKRVEAIYLLTAHLTQLTYQAQQNQGAGGAGMVASATVDGVSVSYVQIPNMNQFDYWLNLTPYGAELLFLLNTLTAVPTYHGGSFERVF